MPPLTRTLAALATLTSLPLAAVPRLVLDENFDDLSRWADLSTALTWQGQPENGSCFQTVDGVLSINAAGLNVPMWGVGGIASFSALDHRFAEPIVHASSTVTIEFRLRFQQVSQNGESNRVAVMLIHDYPQGGLDLTRDARAADFTAPWFGRPAYQVRIRGGSNPPDAAPYMMYGGGRDPLGEFEAGDTPRRWLPGFVSAAGGTSPGTNSSFNYPQNSWMKGDTAPASNTFRRYRYVVSPQTQELWVNRNDDGETWALELSMPAPFEADRPLSPEPPLYRYYPHFEGIRLYFRTAGTRNANHNAFVDWLRVTVDTPLTPAETYAAWAADLPSEQRAPDATPWDDGVPNRLRFALGQPADVAGTAPLPQPESIVVADAPAIRFAFPLRPEVVPQVEWSADLITWQHLASLPGAELRTTTTAQEVFYETTVPATSATPTFLRLNVSP